MPEAIFVFDAIAITEMTPARRSSDLSRSGPRRRCKQMLRAFEYWLEPNRCLEQRKVRIHPWNLAGLPERVLDGFRMMRDNRQQDACRPLWRRSALFPVPDRRWRETKSCGELRLAQTESLAQGSDVDHRRATNLDHRDAGAWTWLAFRIRERLSCTLDQPLTCGGAPCSFLRSFFGLARHSECLAPLGVLLCDPGKNALQVALVGL